MVRNNKTAGEGPDSDRLRLAFEAGAVGAIELDFTTGQATPSDKWREIWGLGDEAVTVAELDSMVFEDDRAERAAAQARALEPGASGLYEARFRIVRRRDTEVRWISSRGQVYFENRVPVRMLGVTRDITDEVSAAAALNEKAKLAEQLSLLTAALPGVTYSYVAPANGPHHLAYLSANFASLTGLDPEAVLADINVLTDRFHLDDAPHLFGKIEQSRRELITWRQVFRFDHPQKGEIWIEGHSQPVRRTDGATVWHGYLQDVTRRETAARSLAASEARVRALKDERLAALEKLAARLAHEVNQPLAAAATLLAIGRRQMTIEADAAQTPRRSGADETLAKAANQILRAGRIIMRLRDFSRFGEPNMTFRQLHTTIREALESIKSDPAFAGVAIETRFGAGRDHVLVDKVQIAQVLSNLVRNAAEAIPASGRRAVAVVTCNAKDNIEISVIDYGTGLSDDARSHLFELFWTNKASGMGVGLAMSKTIVEAHGGGLWAADEVGVGATFTFSLPLFDASENLEYGE